MSPAHSPLSVEGRYVEADVLPPHDDDRPERPASHGPRDLAEAQQLAAYITRALRSQGADAIRRFVETLQLQWPGYAWTFNAGTVAIEVDHAIGGRR